MPPPEVLAALASQEPTVVVEPEKEEIEKQVEKEETINEESKPVDQFKTPEFKAPTMKAPAPPPPVPDCNPKGKLPSEVYKQPVPAPS